MSLAIRRGPSTDTLGGGASGGPDGPLDTLAKIVPADALAAYVALVAIAPGKDSDWWLFGFFLIGVAFTLIFLAVSAKGLPDRPPWWQWPLRIAAFVVYAMAISKPFEVFHKNMDPRWAQAGVVVLSTLAIALGLANRKA